MQLNYVLIVLLTLLSFFGGAFWHGPLFGKLWMKIHWGDKKISDKQMKEMTKGMWKQLLTEFIMTLLMITSLACIIKAIPQFSGIQNAFMAWLGFVVPMTVSNIIWGGDKKEWWMTKILVSISYRLIVFLVAGYALSTWG